MDTKEENIQELTFLVKELDIQIELLNTKKSQAEQQVKVYTKELDTLRTKRQDIAYKLHHVKTSSCSMWENIGEGG
jgi:hypothetical protein